MRGRRRIKKRRARLATPTASQPPACAASCEHSVRTFMAWRRVSTTRKKRKTQYLDTDDAAADAAAHAEPPHDASVPIREASWVGGGSLML